MENSFNRLKELDLSRDEVNRIGEALKNEDFRKLLVDYVEEIQDPKNREIYEEEVKQIEKERGQEVTFLHPTPGYVIKTIVNSNKKAFINVCSNLNIDKPTSSVAFKKGAKGLQWSLPHSLSPPHEDFDNKKVSCQVYDILFHPDTLHLASKNKDFRSMVNNIVVEAVENNFNVTLDKNNLKFPKITFKGIMRASVLRTTSKETPQGRTPEEKEIFDKIYSHIDSQRAQDNVKGSPKKVKARKSNMEAKSSYTTPKYLIKQRSHVDFQEFTEHRNAKLNTTIPKELVIEIYLPLLKSSNDINLDVTEKTVQLISEKPAKYKLNLTLPYQVIGANGTAKFEKDTKKLLITLPVRCRNILETVKDDSGIESCVDSDHNGGANNDDEEEFKPVSVLQNREKSSDKSKQKEEAQKSEIRTCNDDFLSTGDHYNLPEFSCNIFENILAFTLHVKNVDEKTVFKTCSLDESLIKIKFTSISASFYPSCYAFYVKFPSHKFNEEEISVETWDNNVIVQIPLLASDKPFTSYLYGTNIENLSEKVIDEPAVINGILEELNNQPEISRHSVELLTEEIEREASENEISEKPSESKVKNLKFQEVQLNSLVKPVSKAIEILTTSYESSGDELSAGSFSPRKSKGILKGFSKTRSNFGRSISESSLDDFISISYESHFESIEGIPENVKDDEEGMSSSLKKTVRFNDVVARQLFRSNSSILGQKKKNQRKARNKKRAMERRYSESETSDFESKKDGDMPEAPNHHVSEKKDDPDIFHMEINNELSN